MRKKFCLSKDCIISFFTLPTMLHVFSAEFELSYLPWQEKYLSANFLECFQQQNIFIFSGSSMEPSIGLLCKTNSFMLKTKNTADGHFRGLHIQITAMGPSHFHKGRKSLLRRGTRKVCKTLAQLLHITYLWSRWLKSCKFNSLVSCVR